MNQVFFRFLKELNISSVYHTACPIYSRWWWIHREVQAKQYALILWSEKKGTANAERHLLGQLSCHDQLSDQRPPPSKRPRNALNDRSGKDNISSAYAKLTFCTAGTR